jgi:hypothetical protein
MKNSNEINDLHHLMQLIQKQYLISWLIPNANDSHLDLVCVDGGIQHRLQKQ